jgi:hypothetical protein
MKDLAERFFIDADKIVSLEDTATHRSYRAFLNFFDSKKRLSEDDVVVGAYFTYGWMPRMLKLRGDLKGVTEIANRVKGKEMIGEEEIKRVSEAINNSIVGASKLLHFICPSKYAIWDSRVYRYLHQEQPYQYRLETPGEYEKYLETLEELAKDKRFSNMKAKLEKWIGYQVSDKRIAELVMFYTGEKEKKSSQLP